MKKIILPVAFMLSSVIGIAQEYVVKSASKLEGAPPEFAAYGEREMVTTIKGNKIKSETTSMMGTETRLYDGKTHTFLVDMMGNKMGYVATDAEMDAHAKSKDAKPKVETTTEKKTIAGYECTKSIVTSTGKDNKEQKITVWATDKINFDLSKVKKDAQSRMMDFGDLKGYPMSIETDIAIQGQNMKLVIATTEVSTKPVDDSAFKVSTEGYKMMTYAEAMDMMKSMAR